RDTTRVRASLLSRGTSQAPKRLSFPERGVCGRGYAAPARVPTPPGTQYELARARALASRERGVHRRLDRCQHSVVRLRSCEDRGELALCEPEPIVEADPELPQR